jgi:hypothetical protein
MISQHYIKSAILLLAFSLTAHLSAQKLRPSHGEVGMNFGSLNVNSIQFSGFWKKQLAPDKYRRFRFFSGNLFFGTQDESFVGNLSVGLAIGREKRINLDEKLQFYRGFEAIGSLNVSSGDDDDSTPWNFSPAIGFVFGLQHAFNSRWAINVETIPTLGVLMGSNDPQLGSLFTFNATVSNTLSLGIVRIF